MLKAQKALEGDALVTTVLFYDKYELLHDRIDIKAVAPLTGKDYTVRGSTALLDAVGRTIDKIRNAQEHTAADYRAEKVLFVIITDWMENASREYSAKWVKGRIERQRQKYGWEFVFLGANMDAVAEAGKLGIDADRAQSYQSDAYGTGLAWGSASKATSAIRTGAALDGWSDMIGNVSSRESAISESDDSDGVLNSENAAEALENVKAALKGIGETTGELIDMMKAVEANDGKPVDVNEILRNVLEGK